MTVMFLINAIYFKGSWTYEFDKNDTRTQPFYMSNSSETDCDMMKQENVFSRYFNQEFQAVDLPYGNAGFSMAIFLPRQDKSLDDLISQMNENTWKNWLENFSEDTTILYLPKFRMEYNRILNDDLTALGMGIAFDKDGADFSRINPFIQLFISRVIHKTFVQVDEKGTEASAVTVVEVGFTSGGQDNYMTVNRPFIFVIHDNYTGSILFMGKITNPIWEE